MPRGPGKKENYNFDYSRFNGLDPEAESKAGNVEPEPDHTAEMMRHLPGELQEAFRLMQIARQTGDIKAQERANELALKAVERGGPEMKQRFQQEVMRQAAKDPEARKGVEAILNSQDPNKSRGTPIADGLAREGDRLGRLTDNIESLQAQMKAGQERAAKQLEAMKEQQEKLNTLTSPEDFAKFVSEQGFSQEDLQRMMSGDEEYMRKCFERTLGQKADGPDMALEEGKKLDEALEAVDKIHKELNDLPDSEPPPASPPSAPSGGAKPAGGERAKKPAAPEPAIPNHRVQYQKDEAGRLLSVELRCDLPGVQKMADVELDISEKYLRLRTLAPAYVVNVGPFPNLVDPPATEAKFSKKKQELTVRVPAKP